jgi:hypothetical protein
MLMGVGHNSLDGPRRKGVEQVFVRNICVQFSRPSQILHGWLASAARRNCNSQPTRARLLRAKRCLTADYCYFDEPAHATLILSMK